MYELLTDEERHKMHNFKISLRENNGALSKSSCHWLIDKVNEQEKEVANLKELLKSSNNERDCAKEKAREIISDTVHDLNATLEKI